ncbi:hypothetical protein NERG_01859 [Nematocida ausubeli]|uniref:Uncharacterized protein n=1 Tax=Nematocida ausubeli (strain ATCC PRA-371 / ERTm2) TaxID=1913371 RepID=H8ZE38_NEMA1|nr:hypothetical protein NERG_01859 [Nematocida ausubeli]
MHYSSYMPMRLLHAIAALLNEFCPLFGIFILGCFIKNPAMQNFYSHENTPDSYFRQRK